MSAISVSAVSAAVQRLLIQMEHPVLVDPENRGQAMTVSPADAAEPDAWLPVFVICAEALWFELTGTGFDLRLVPAKDSALGYRLATIGAGSYSALMLCMIDVTLQLETTVDGRPALLLNRLIDLWGVCRARASDVPSALRESAA